MSETTPETLRAEYAEQVRRVRSDETLSWEKRELRIRQLGQQLDRRLKELEEKGP
jgi:hypothetical protein